MKLLTSDHAKVISRSSSIECQREWIGITEDYVEEAYGPPCDTIVRYGNILLYDRETKSFVRKRKI